MNLSDAIHIGCFLFVLGCAFREQGFGGINAELVFAILLCIGVFVAWRRKGEFG